MEVVDKEDIWHLEKIPSKRGNCMAWPTHEDHFQSTFQFPPMSNVASESAKKFHEGFGTIMLVLAGLWKLWTWKTSGTLKKNPSERGNSMVWPTHEDDFQSTCHPPPVSNVASDSTKKL